MSVLVYDCGSVENTVTAILDTESGAMIVRGNGDIDNYADESSPWYSEHSDILQVTVDKGITRIGSGTFYGCENLSFVEIANTVTTIGADVFQNCNSLTSIKIPKSITAIGNGTFADSGLTEVKFYGNPPTVGTDIFDGVTADVYTPEGNEEWSETAKGTVAGNGSNLTWKTFDSKPNLIEYDELDYFWSKIKKWVNDNKSDSSLPIIDDKTFIKYLTSVISDSNHTNTSTTLYVSNPEYFAEDDCFYVKKDSTHFFYGIVSAVNNNTGALTYSIPASDGGTFFSPDDGQDVLNYGNPMNGGVYLDWANDRVDLYKNHTASLERDYNIYDPILNINAWDSTTASIAEEDGVVDISGEDNHGQAFGGVTVVKDKVMGRCFYFDIAKREVLWFDRTIDWSQPFTISMRINPFDLSYVPCFFDTRNDTNNSNFFFGTVGATDFRIRFIGRNASDSFTYYSNTRLQLYIPTTLTITVENYIVKIYFDGILDSTHTMNPSVILELKPYFSVGGFRNYSEVANRTFTGLISAIRIFDKALTSEEVQVIYKQSLVTPYINSNMYDPILNLDADYSTTASIAEENGVIDVSGNHNNGQASGGVVVNNGTYEFDGTAVKQIVFNTSYPISNNAITLAVKIKHLGRSGKSDGYNVIFGNNIILCYSPAGSICFQLKNNSNANVYRTDSVETSIVDGNTHLLLCIMYIENGTIHFSTYLDNVLQTISSTTGSTDATVLYNGSGPIVIGELSSVTSYSYMSNMQIFDVKIFDKALNETERYNVYQQSLNPEAFENPEKLISYDEINVHHFDNDSLVQDTMFRIGNLNGILGITDNRQGVFIGDENEYIKFDKVNGLKINATVQNAVNTDKLNIKQYNGGSWQGILSVNQDTKDDTYNQILLSKEENNSNDIGYYIDPDATTGNQRVILKLGNSTDNSSLRGHSGEFWMFGSGTTYTRIIPNNTSNITLTLPNTTGTLALEKQGSVPIYYVQGPSTDTTAGTWTGSITGLTAYYDGLTILYVPAVAGASATTLNINNLGAKTCYFTNTSALTTHYSVGTPILFTYRDNAWRRADYNANTTYSAMSVSEGTTGTATTSRTMRADYLKQIIAGLPSASCTGNAASSTYTSNIRVAKNTAAAWYPLVFVTGSTANTNYAPKYHPGLNVDCYDGTTSANGYCFLQLGTATAFGTAGNAYGGIYMYKKATSTYKTPKRVIIVPPNVAAATDADVTLTLPNSTGTIALTSSNITGTATYATNAKLTHTVGNSEYPLVFGTSFVITDAQQALRIGTPTATAANCPLRVKAYCAAANTQGEAYIVIGNNLAKASANNARGGLVMYGTGTAYNFIKMNTVSTNGKTIFLNTANTGDITLTLPAITGKILVSSDSTPVVDVKVVSSLPSSPVANTVYLVK